MGNRYNEHKPDDKSRAEVAALVSFGVPREEIAAYIGIDAKTLRKHYADEIAKAKTTADANVARFLYRSASGQALKDGATYADCIRAAMFWAKTRMQWRETDDLTRVQEQTPFDGWHIDRAEPGSRHLN